MEQTFIWTVLPNGVRTDTTGSFLKFSVFVSIRLRDPNGQDFTLANVPDVLDWPAFLRHKTRLEVEIQGQPLIPADQVRVDFSPLDPPLWSALFRKEQLVKSYLTEDLRERFIRSFPASQVQKFVEDLYAGVGHDHGVKPPNAGDLGKILQDISFRTDLTQPGEMQEKGSPRETTAMKGTLKGQVIQKLEGIRGSVRTSLERDVHALLPSKGGVLKPEGLNILKSIAKDLEVYGYVHDRSYSPMKAFMQAIMFHSAHSGMVGTDASTVKMASNVPTVPVFDFHEALSLLGEHPSLLRKLGLVLDVECPLPNAVPVNGIIRVRPEGSKTIGKNQTLDAKKNTNSGQAAVSTIHVSPGTVFSHDQKTFRANPKTGSDINGGLLDLSDEKKFQIVKLDIDGSAIKLVNLADQMDREGYIVDQAEPVLLASTGNGYVTGLDLNSTFSVSEVAAVAKLIDPDRATLPALRSAGVAVVKAARDGNVKLAIKTSMAHEEALVPSAATKKSPADPDSKLMYADDLVRGYRVDIFDQMSGRWLPLCGRTATYDFLHVPKGDSTTEERTIVIEDEGIVAMGLSEPTDKSTDDLFVHEALFHWTGWSLVAPRPGKVTNDQNNAVEAGKDTLQDFGLHISAKAGNTQLPRLPKLRFGNKYRIRARLADIAGNGPLLSDFTAADMTGATGETTYERFEPVASPTAMVATTPQSGESLHVAAVRSNGGVSPDEYASAHGLKVSSPERLIGPPAAMQQMVETHGLFDGMSDEDSYKLMVERDRPYAITNGPAVQDTKGRAKFGMPVITDASFAIPYLPDPMALGVAFVFSDRHGKAVATTLPPAMFRQHGESWYEPVPMRVRVVEGTGEPFWKDDHLLVVPLPKAEALTMAYSSIVGEAALDAHGIWNIIASKAGAEIGSLKSAALKGAHWMITPSRTMRLVHAVQQPLVKPAFSKLVPIKTLGATFAVVHGHMTFDGKSSAAVELRATWTDPIDDLAAPKPDTVTGFSQIFNQTVDQFADTYLFGDQTIQPQAEEAGGAMKLSKAPLSGAVNTSTKKMVTTLYQHEDLQKSTYTGFALSDAVREDQTKKRIALQKAFAPLFVPEDPKRHEIGDTKYHLVTYQAVATSRFREFFVDLITEDPSEQKSDPRHHAVQPTILNKAKKQGLTFTQEGTLQVKVLNSARPALPKVLYMMPTFQWEEERDPKTIVRRRCGGGLRVYLDRPWYSSGDEELLGVIIKNEFGVFPDFSKSGNPNLPMKREALEHYVSHWGYDPIWDSLGGLKSVMKVSDFQRTAHKGEFLPIAELDGAYVDVAGYKPEFDEHRKLWYADIVVDPGTAYFPFVKLALARYQPNSVDGAHLSPIVTSEFMQVVPDRVAAATVDGTGKIVVQVSGPSAMKKQMINDVTSIKTPSRVVTAVLERSFGPDLAWVPMEDESAAVLDQAELKDSKILWRREIPEPEGFSAGRGKGVFRVVIKEEEMFDNPGHEANGSFNAGRRPIYADVIEL